MISKSLLCIVLSALTHLSFGSKLLEESYQSHATTIVQPKRVKLPLHMETWVTASHPRKKVEQQSLLLQWNPTEKGTFFWKGLRFSASLKSFRQQQTVFTVQLEVDACIDKACYAFEPEGQYQLSAHLEKSGKLIVDQNRLIASKTNGPWTTKIYLKPQVQPLAMSKNE